MGSSNLKSTFALDLSQSLALAGPGGLTLLAIHFKPNFSEKGPIHALNDFYFNRQHF